MKSTVEKISPLERRLNVTIPAGTVGDSFKEVWKNVQSSAQIKGFRAGKAPLNALRPIYQGRVTEEVVQHLIRRHYYDALVENKLEPINYPNFEFDLPKEDQDFSFSASVEVRPEIKLKKYEGLEVEREKFSFDETRIDQVLENIRSSKAQLVPILEDRPAEKGDIAVIDFAGIVDGKPLENGKAENHELELGSDQFIPGFEQGILGMKVGSEKSLQLKFPDEYHAADIAGKPVEFKVSLKALKRKELPELTDEFLKSIGSDESVEQLRQKIKEDLEASQKKKIDSDFKNRLLKALVIANPVDVPPSMLKEQKQVLVDDLRQRMMSQGMNEGDFANYLQKWDKDFEATAAQMIQAGFLVDQIATEKNLHCTDQDKEAKLEAYAKQTGIDMTRIREFYGQDEQDKKLQYQITEDKVVAFLTEVAKIKEVEAAKLSE